MITMTCKCGNNTITFPHLSANDFPNGWENDCCPKAEVPKSVQKRLEIQKEAEIEVVETKLASESVLSKVWNTPEEDKAWADLEAATAPETPIAEPERKKPGRKPKV